MSSSGKEAAKKLTLSEYFQVSGTAGDVAPPMVKIYVGPDRKLWVLPEKILCDRVKFFKSAFQSGFQESKEKILELPEDDPIAFEFIVNLILGEIYTTAKKLLGFTHDTRQLMWCKVYVLADKLDCKEYVDAEDSYQAEFINEMDVCRTLGSELPLVASAAVKYIYENTAEESSMRGTLAWNLAMRQLTKPRMKASQIEEWVLCASIHPRFHVDVMTSIQDHIAIEDYDDCGVDECVIHRPEE